MSGKNIQVAIKVRPLLRKEIDLKLPCNWKIINNSIQLNESQTDPFYFDHIFDQNVTNKILFDKVAKPIIDATLEGFNGTIFAYGQTSSGKTYTMLGDENNPGVIVLAAKEIFKEIENSTDRKFLLRVGYIEIYNEKIYDLLNKNNQDLKIHETPNGDVSVNCENFIITSEAEMIHYLQTGNKSRKCGETNMNERSSRSHALFILTIESRKVDENNDDGCVQTSILNLVDLAGSERADQTCATGSRLNEGRHINRSLLYLSCVIKRLSENESHKFINYRDSKLTRILQASLGGNALTAIICTIKPTSIEETNSTLSFAMRAKAIKNKPEVNEVLSDAAMMKRLEKEIMRLQNALEVEKNKNNKMSEKELRVSQLESKIREESLKIIHPNCTDKQKNRRRTWCPSSNEIVLEKSQNLPLNESESNLRDNIKPMVYLTPLVTIRDEYDLFANKFSDSKSILDISAEFKTPTALKNNCQLLSLSPSPSYKTKYYGLLNEMEELKIFTNFEKKFNVEHDTIGSLSIKLEESQKKINELEHQETELKASIDNFKERIQHLENKISDDNKDLQEKDKQNKLLIEKNKQLQFECNEKNSIEYEFEQFKIKSKKREAELIEAINEKDKKINILKKDFENKQENVCNKCTLDTDVILKLQKNLELFKSENKRIQMEYDDLSSELMESIQENDTLKQNYNKAQNEINSLNLLIDEFFVIKNDLVNYKEQILYNNNLLNRLILNYEKRNCNLLMELENKGNENLKLSEKISKLQFKYDSDKLYVSFLLGENQNFINLLTEKVTTESITTQTDRTERVNIDTQTDQDNIQKRPKSEQDVEQNLVTEKVTTEDITTQTDRTERVNIDTQTEKVTTESITTQTDRTERVNIDTQTDQDSIQKIPKNEQDVEQNLVTEKLTTESITTQTDRTERVNIDTQTDQDIIEKISKNEQEVEQNQSKSTEPLNNNKCTNCNLNDEYNFENKNFVCSPDEYEKIKKLLEKSESQQLGYELENNSLKDLLNQKTMILKECLNEINILKNEKTVNSNGNINLLNEKNNLSAALNAKKIEINKLIKLNSDYSNIILNNDTDIKQMKSECKFLKESNSKLTEYINTLQEEYRLLKIKKDSKSADNSLEEVKVQDKIRDQNAIEIEAARQNNHHKERKCRRQSTHDETRQCLWDSSQSVSTMTDPMNQFCDCKQLEEIVSELRRKILIKDSQIETLRMELISNQFKDDIKMLQKMLLEEESEKKELLSENRNLKQQLTEYRANTDTSNDDIKSIKMKLKHMESVCAVQAENILTISNEGKDLEKISNLRYERIKELERQISHVTHNDANRSTHIEQQLKKLTEDHELLKKKYQDAKTLCYCRIEEIGKLKQQINQFKKDFNVQELYDQKMELSNICEELRRICRLRNERIRELEKEILNIKEKSMEQSTR